MSEAKTTIPADQLSITIMRVPNGWVVYPDIGFYSQVRSAPAFPLAVARTERELAGMIQGWAEVIAEKQA